MPTYRVTEVTDVEAGSEEQAIEKVSSDSEGEVVSQSAKAVFGCPICGSARLTVTTSAVGTVQIVIEGEHIDEVEWGALEDIDLVEASSFDCRACGHHQEVSGDTDLYYTLNLQWG